MKKRVIMQCNAAVLAVVAGGMILTEAPVLTEITSQQIMENMLNYNIQNVNETFENGDFYNMNRYTYKENSNELHTQTLTIKGDNIMIRYIDQETKQATTTVDTQKLKHTTLFVTTNKESYIIGVPAVYSNNTQSNTLTILREQEIPVTIEKGDGCYEVKISFPQKTDIITEFWYMKSESNMNSFSTQNTLEDFLLHDISQTKRWAMDGYYFQTAHNYIPGGEDVLYNHPSCLAGIALAKYGKTQFAKNLGYMMVKTNINNQNEAGYWATGPKSEWLYTDFSIEGGFYDTRFNSDFVISLLVIYENTKDEEYLNAAIRYAEFYFDFAEKNHYTTPNGGIFVADYGHTQEHEKTHVSLNHFLTEIEVLLRLYDATNEQEYYDFAQKMFLAIDYTKKDWVLPNNNLEYAMYYTKNTNLMIDYVYLTYNDMFNMQELLETKFNTRSETLDYLMNAKRTWLIANNANDYKK